jgi:hypothetical protein
MGAPTWRQVAARRRSDIFLTDVGVWMLERSDWDSKDSALGGRITCRLRDLMFRDAVGRIDNRKKPECN